MGAATRSPSLPMKGHAMPSSREFPESYLGACSHRGTSGLSRATFTSTSVWKTQEQTRHQSQDCRTRTWGRVSSSSHRAELSSTSSRMHTPSQCAPHRRNQGTSWYVHVPYDVLLEYYWRIQRQAAKLSCIGALAVLDCVHMHSNSVEHFGTNVREVFERCKSVWLFDEAATRERLVQRRKASSWAVVHQEVKEPSNAAVVQHQAQRMFNRWRSALRNT